MTFDILNTPKKSPLLDQLFTVNGTLVMTIFLMGISTVAERLNIFPFLPEGFGFGLYYLLIGIPVLLVVSAYRSYWYRKETTQVIGNLKILPEGATISTGDEETHYPLKEITRMDVRFAYGGERPFRNNENIHQFKILRVSGFFGGKKLEYIVSNRGADGKTGALTSHLEEIRKTSLDHFQKIQLWERYE